jgi:hypothetical protein
MEDIRAKLVHCAAKLHKQFLLGAYLGVDGNAKLILLIAGAALAKTVYGVADLKYTELLRVAAVLLKEGEESGNHRGAQIMMVGSLCVYDPYVLGSCDAKLAILLDIRPDVGMNLVESVALNEDILHSVLIALKHLLTNGKEG